MRRATVYTDGACIKDNVGGWGWITTTGYMDSGQVPDTTNQRMELEAALHAVGVLAWHYDEIVVVSDSAYLVNCFNNNWYFGWERNGWRNSKGMPVANQDLWQELIRLNSDFSVIWRKVKGHSGDPMNDKADELATCAARGTKHTIRKKRK